MSSSSIQFNMRFVGNDTNELKRAIKWMNRGGLTELDKSIQIQAKQLVKELKKNLRRGGRPKFQPIAKFSHIVRLSYGLKGKKRGRRTDTLIKSVKRHRVGTKADRTWFAGVKKGEVYVDKVRGYRHDAFHFASILENGRNGYVIELDRPSPRTGKTPRSWLTWLYFQGRLKNLPSKSKKYLHIKPAPKAPFVKQVLDSESQKVALRVQYRWVNKLYKKFPSVRAV